MKKWWYWIRGALLLSLLFIAIPVKYSRTDSDKKEQLRPIFNEYVLGHNKSYKNDPLEYERRFDHFLESLAEIDRLNNDNNGLIKQKARYGLTILSDMSKKEFIDIHLSDEKISPNSRLGEKSKKDIGNNKDKKHKYNFKNRDIINSSESMGHIEDLVRQRRVALPMQVDWRDKGAIGSVKYQGVCGACWAFSTVGTIETMVAINTGKLQELSVQEMIDCARLGNSGCSGGDICLLLDWLLLTGTPVEYDTAYPLRLTDGVCRVNNNTNGVRVKSYSCNHLVNDEQKLLTMLATHGPVAIAVNALTWQNYLGGVIQYHCSGSVLDLNHAVQLVGYNLDTEVPYYIAKNSWGTEFGEEGYLKLAVGNNICGLANEVAWIDV